MTNAGEANPALSRWMCRRCGEAGHHAVMAPVLVEDDGSGTWRAVREGEWTKRDGWINNDNGATS